jgi:hypothetical protein
MTSNIFSESYLVSSVYKYFTTFNSVFSFISSSSRFFFPNIENVIPFIGYEYYVPCSNGILDNSTCKYSDLAAKMN